MDEENRRVNWSSFFIKGIIVIIFILFTVWLLSLTNKGVNKSLGVLTDNVFSENIDKMKEAGKDYFTNERLPQKVGEIETISLAKMYDLKLLLELKDKNGNFCSATNSYVSVEKFDNEYQMKVYLECGEESDYIIVIMGCYDYCDTDICEKKDDSSDSTKQIEYEYKKATGGKWTDYGSWSEWSKISVTKTDYRQVETKIVKEEYSYDKTVIETKYEELKATCPEGYKKTSDGTKCYKEDTTTVYTDKTCASTYNGYTLVSQNGNICNYKKTSNVTTNPTCPSTYNGYTFYARDGFTCKYSKSVSYSYQVPVTISKTCYTTRSQLVTPCTGCAPQWQTIKIPYDCSTTSNETRYDTKTEYTTGTASCPYGTSQSGSTCVSTQSQTITTNAVCPIGYNTSSDGRCYKNSTNTKYENISYSCPAGYDNTNDGRQCYKEVPTTVQVTGTKDVTYYRYRIREYIGGTVDYKWSTSKEDKELLNAGYVLTGRTR